MFVQRFIIKRQQKVIEIQIFKLLVSDHRKVFKIPKDWNFLDVCLKFLESLVYYYRLTNWLMFLCGQIQSPRPDITREGIARAESFVAARIESSAS